MKPARARRAFSLVEMMIALVILGLGLLFIAAALPAGIDYSRDTVDQINGEAAAEFALDTLEMTLATSDKLVASQYWNPPTTTQLLRIDSVHRPREGGNFGPAMLTQPATTPESSPTLGDRPYEPIIKVRPFVLGNAQFAGRADVARHLPVVDNTEAAISTFLSTQSITGTTVANPYREADYPPSGTFLPLPGSAALADNPLLSILSRVYPPTAPALRHRLAEATLADPEGNSGQFFVRDMRALTDSAFHVDREKAFDRRLAWTAFYRRVSYAIGSSPHLYEVIVVVTRRPTLNHRYAFQDLRGGALAALQVPMALPAATNGPPAIPAVGDDRLAPTPWLVTFTKLPAFPLPAQYVSSTPFPPSAGAVVTLNDKFVAPPTLTFECSPEVARLLPVGAQFIPARNDDLPQGLGARLLGYLPSAPQSAPIYRVIDRPSATAVVVENNGLYPFAYPGTPFANPISAGAQWPVWVIPPAFSQRDGNGQPLYDRQSPIVFIARRLVTLEVR